MNRKIAFVPALSAYFAMPAGYDPGKITRDDATNDSAICGATEELSALRAESKKTSSMARETVDDVTDEELSELAAIDEEWGDAIRALRDGQIDDVRGHLERAQEFAARWGSSQHEDQALAMLPEVA